MKTPEQLENERKIEQKLETFTKACENGDARTASEEFQKYLATGGYVPVVKVCAAIDFFKDQKAWDEGSQTILAVVKRGLESHLPRRMVCVTGILENSKPEVVKEIGAAMKPETRRKFKKIFKREAVEEK